MVSREARGGLPMSYLRNGLEKKKMSLGNSLINVYRYGTLLLTVLGFCVNGPPHAKAADNTAASSGPVRLARFSYVKGDVNWRRDAQGSWAGATMNLPLRQAAQIWTDTGGRGEIQFDDGSRLRIGNDTLVTLQTLYSDADGEFTEITLNNGEATLRLQSDHSVYQVNTPLVSVNATGPGRIELRANQGTQISVLKGSATIEGKQGKTTLVSGNYIDLRDENSTYSVVGLPRPDTYSVWSETRDRNIDGYTTHHAQKVLPPNIALVQNDLDEYGTWHSDAKYGDVWCPRHTAADWRPYSNGEWVWSDPYGWTWVAREPWGWAPYHYGTWVHESYGWGWVHGPVTQYWSPAVVSFADYNGSQVWVPLAPAEVSYPPSLSIGGGGGNWSLYFSIGSAGVYYPDNYGRFSGRPWGHDYVNRTIYVNNTTVINNTTIYNNGNTYIANRRYVPMNARFGGATMTNTASFGGRGSFRPVPRTSANNVFMHGRLVAAPANGMRPFSGPAAVRANAVAMTPGRSFRSNVRIPQNALNRPVFRSPLNPAIARTSRPPLHTASFSPKPGNPAIGRHTIGAAAPGGLRPGFGRPAVNNSNHPAAMTSPGRVPGHPSAIDKARNARQALGIHTNPNRPSGSFTGHAQANAHPAANARVNGNAQGSFHPTAANHNVLSGAGLSNAAIKARQARQSVGVHSANGRPTGSFARPSAVSGHAAAAPGSRMNTAAHNPANNQRAVNSHTHSAANHVHNIAPNAHVQRTAHPAANRPAAAPVYHPNQARNINASANRHVRPAAPAGGNRSTFQAHTRPAVQPRTEHVNVNRQTRTIPHPAPSRPGGSFGQPANRQAPHASRPVINKPMPSRAPSSVQRTSDQRNRDHGNNRADNRRDDKGR